MKTARDVIFEPIVSEKSYARIDEDNTYTFLVDRRANKTEIRQAVEEIFDVRVLSVNTLNRRGKRKRTGYVIGKRADAKHAIVKLAIGDTIDLFGV